MRGQSRVIESSKYGQPYAIVWRDDVRFLLTKNPKTPKGKKLGKSSKDITP